MDTRESSGVVKLIFDTDMDFDVDNFGTLCAFHGLVSLGEAEILAVGMTMPCDHLGTLYDHFRKS